VVSSEFSLAICSAVSVTATTVNKTSHPLNQFIISQKLFRFW
jgi:hypothetical protein